MMLNLDFEEVFNWQSQGINNTAAASRYDKKVSHANEIFTVLKP